MKLTARVILLSIILAGCSSVSSIREPAADNDGLVYYMPKKDFLVTVTKANDQTTVVSLTTTGAYADISKPFVLKHSGNLLGKNALKVGIEISGLLKTSKSTTTSGVSEALKNLGETFGTLHGFRAGAADLERASCGNGIHTFIFHASINNARACEFNITIIKLVPTKLQSSAKLAGETYSGIFYKQAEPYLITATGPINTSAIVLSPNEAPLAFLPISRTFFSNNEADFGFTDGMPTKYDQDTDGELIALFKLPATVIAAYFTAIGTIFDSFKGRDTKEAETLAASVKLEIAKKKYDACLAAIIAKDDTTIAKLECGK